MERPKEFKKLTHSLRGALRTLGLSIDPLDQGTKIFIFLTSRLNFLKSSCNKPEWQLR